MHEQRVILSTRGLQVRYEDLLRETSAGARCSLESRVRLDKNYCTRLWLEAIYLL
jgi:hypothetical protein